MNWIKVTDALPLAGKEVLCVVEYHGHKYYQLGYLCCREGWKLHNKTLDPVLIWAELPAIEPE